MSEKKERKPRVKNVKCNNPRNEVIVMRVSSHTKELLKEIAKRRHISVTDYILEVLMLRMIHSNDLYYIGLNFEEARTVQ